MNVLEFLLRVGTKRIGVKRADNKLTGNKLTGNKRTRMAGAWAMRGAYRRQCGATLPIVLALTAMLQLLAMTQADMALIAQRTAGARRDRLIAFEAADSGLVLCLRSLARGAAPVRPWTGSGEPAYWRSGHAFSGPAPAAFALRANWPGAAAAPQCLIESRPMVGQESSRPARLVYLLTVRGLGSRIDTQNYMQEILVDPDTNRGTAPQGQGWRSVAASPEG